MEKILVAWSSGKDSAVALYEILKSQAYDVVALLTTVTEAYDRVSMHGVRRTLLEQQAISLGIPLEKVFISVNSSNEAYELKMQQVLKKYLAAGVTKVAFGDIFLEDVRKYREGNLARVGMEGIFPLWQRDSNELARGMIELGFRAVVACVDSHALDGAFTGREFDTRFLRDIPPAVDPCGENGEFHTFVYDGPIFQNPIHHTKGEIVQRENRFFFCDLIPDSA